MEDVYEHLIQWSTAEHNGLSVLLFAYSRSTREYEIKSLYPPYEKHCLEQKSRIASFMEAVPFRILQNPDDFLVDCNTDVLFWAAARTEFRRGSFAHIVRSLCRERVIRA